MPGGAGFQDGTLRLFELGRGHGLHGLGDLLGILNAFDASSQID